MKNKRHRKGLHVLFMLFALAAIPAIIMLLWNWLIIDRSRKHKEEKLTTPSGEYGEHLLLKRVCQKSFPQSLSF